MFTAATLPSRWTTILKPTTSAQDRPERGGYPAKTLQRTLLILDIDETLVRADVEVPRADFEAGLYRVVKRPFVDEFLAAVAEWYDLAVWTSGGAGYASQIVPPLFGPFAQRLKFIWANDRCTRRYDHETMEYCDAKPLKKLRRRGYSLERVLVVDDSPEKHRQNYGNLVRVRPFLGDSDHTELRDLVPFLESLRGVPDVRAVEKRGWRGYVRYAPRP